MSTMVIALVVVVVLIVAGGAAYYYVTMKKSPSSSNGVNESLEMGGFDNGQIVTFLYNGTNTELCTPSATSLFPSDPNASLAATHTACEVGAADQNAVPQVPQYILVPAFAGLSIFGVPALGASSHGFPEVNGSVLLTQCGAGGTSTACPAHPTYIYSPEFTAVEDHLGIAANAEPGGLPPGTLPTPAHDHLIDTATTYPNVYWGITVVLVLDPNIYPAQMSPTCTASVPSNLSSATGNCLTSYAALQRAMTTCSSSAVAFNSAVKNPIWQTLGSGCDQVVVPGGSLGDLNANLYIPFSVSPGAPPMFPS
jgi:hypothetical protein